MPHLRSCLPLAASATAVGALVVAGWYTLRHRQRSFGLSDALRRGAVGGLIGLAVGVALCVLRDGIAQPGGGAIGAWVGRFLPFAGPGVIAGAIFGVVTAFAITWGLGRLRRPSDSGPAA